MKAPAEGPEHRTDTLSPVSPKPQYFPAPSNIALLETQMDPEFEETSHWQLEEAALNGEAGTDGQELKNGSMESVAQDPQTNTQNRFTHTDVNTFPSNTSQPSPALSYSLSEQHNASTRSEPTPSSNTQATSATPIKVESQINGQTNGYLDHVDAPRHDFLVPTNPSATPSSAGIDIQALLDGITASSNLSTAPTTETLNATTSQTNETHATENVPYPSMPPPSQDESALPPADNANLPPRPPVQTLPAYAQSQELAGLINTESTSSPTASLAPLAHTAPASFTIAGAPGLQVAPSISLPPPPIPHFSGHQQHSSFTSPGQGVTPTSVHQTAFVSQPGEDVKRGPGGEMPWSPETQKKYDGFLEAERRYVMEGNWEKFPEGSRMFLGNLPSEKVTKRDLFHVFHKHGKLAQISIKQAYGFVQYLEASDCARAMKAEEGVAIRGKAIHLEVSTPGGKKRSQQNEGQSSRNRRRSRSPAGIRGVGRNSHNDNPYRPRSSDRFRTREDHYGLQRMRSPMLPQSIMPSRPPHGDAQLLLPHRRPENVPDVQLIAKDPLEHQYVEDIKTRFAQRGLRTDFLFLAGLDEALVVQRQILERVLAIMRVDRLSQTIGRYHLTVFDRTQGEDNIRYEEYQNHELNTVIELANRAKQTMRPSYGTPQPLGMYPPMPAADQQGLGQGFYSQPPRPPPVQGFEQLRTPPVPPPQANTSPHVDNDRLQHILNSLNRQPQAATPNAFTPQPSLPNQAQQSQHQAPQSASQDLAQILSVMQRTSGGTPQSAMPPTVNQGGQYGQQLTSNPHDMSQIMAQLNRYGR